jgi:hypothetical protein
MDHTNGVGPATLTRNIPFIAVNTIAVSQAANAIAATAFTTIYPKSAIV